MVNRNQTFHLGQGTFSAGLAVCLAVLFFCSPALADQSLENDNSWHVNSNAQVSVLLRSSLEQLGSGAGLIAQASEQFDQRLLEGDGDQLDAFVAAVASINSAVERLADAGRRDPMSAAASIDPSAAEYAEIESLPGTIRSSVRTWLGRSLVRDRLYDEALPVTAEVNVQDSIDPASTLFYRGACYHALMMKKEALSDLRQLLENEDDCPVRFSRLAKLMVADIKPLKEDSLDEISRLMVDVTRRLDLGRAGGTVEDQEQKIIDKLTKLIEKLEEQQQQQQQQQQGSGSGGGDAKSGDASPMQDSQIAGGSGDGNVDKKDLGDDSGWGNLPPAERKEALQKISRDLPTHYRDAIEAYFRKRATDG